MQSLAVLCPCMPIPGSVDKQPIRDDTSDRDGEEGSPSLALKAKGWLGKLAAPITAMKDDYDKERAREAKLEELKAGATMVLQADGSTLKAGTMVKIAVSSDGTMVTWTASGVSGVMAMSAIREVKPVMSSTFFSKPAPIPKQFKLIADDQIVSFEAKDDDVKAQWMSTLEECAAAAAEAKVGRKMMQQAKRRMGLDETHFPLYLLLHRVTSYFCLRGCYGALLEHAHPLLLHLLVLRLKAHRLIFCDQLELARDDRRLADEHDA